MESTCQASVIREARKGKRFTQQAVADKSGISAKTVRRAEAGRKVGSENLLSIFATLGLVSDRVPMALQVDDAADTKAAVPDGRVISGRQSGILHIDMATLFVLTGILVGVVFKDLSLVAWTVAYTVVARSMEQHAHRIRVTRDTPVRLILILLCALIPSWMLLSKVMGHVMPFIF